jgi:hypothetical protein
MLEIIIKIILVPIAGFLFFKPLISADLNAGIIFSFQSHGLFLFASAIILFYILIGFYSLSLYNCLKKVSKSSLTVAPESVWKMFIIPLNFIEDFFIIRNVSRAIKSEKLVNPKLVSISSSGSFSGYLWCTMQLFSLIPNNYGEIGGLLALPFWFYHWHLILKVNKLLS